MVRSNRGCLPRQANLDPGMGRDDGSRVNAKTLSRALAVLGGCAALMGCASTPKANVVSMGDGTYSITLQASSGLTRNTEKLKAEATAEATRFCAKQGKQLKVIALTDERPLYTMGYASARIVFKPLDAGDPGLTSEPPVPVATVATPAPSGDLYAELTKLDELRKKGILTEKEFQSEKKKVLDRSR
jgi:hypothetical protein